MVDQEDRGAGLPHEPPDFCDAPQDMLRVGQVCPDRRVEERIDDNELGLALSFDGFERSVDGRRLEEINRALDDRGLAASWIDLVVLAPRLSTRLWTFRIVGSAIEHL